VQEKLIIVELQSMQPAVRTRRRRTTTVVVPLPSAVRRVPLSPLDTRWVALPPMCHVFFFPAAAAQVPFSDIVSVLRSSLAAVLPAFHPLAGEVAYSPQLGTVSIVYGEDDAGGVAFVESETDLDFARLVADRDDDDDALLQLVPDIAQEELPAPVFAAQVTEFVQGSRGIALGVAFNHVAMDGIGFFRFMEMWGASAMAAAGASSHATEPPLHDRRLVRFDGDEELAGRLLRQVAPDLPRVSSHGLIK
jgi:hypothetical protein